MKRNLSFLLLFCILASRARAATTALPLDTRSGIRTAAEVETIVWNSVWGPDGTQVVSIEADDGSLSFSANAPGSGTAAWNTAAANAGVRTLALRADDTAVCTARFLVRPENAGSATTTLSLDTRTGVRRAAAVESIAWDTAWCPAGTIGILVAADDGSLLFSANAPGSGTAAWNAAAANAGVRTLSLLADGMTFYTAQFAVRASYLTPEPVPYAWLDEYRLGDGSEDGYETAALATAANGANKVWECYVAGLSPTNATARFEARVDMVDGAPVVTWDPDLGAARDYVVEGKTNLVDRSWGPTNESTRFYRVKVKLPE